MRRRPLRSWRLGGLLVAALSAACSPRATVVDLRPIQGQNVLLITIDTLRADALGCYGGPAATPVLDRLASEGVRFDFAHAHAVTTLASHASILTGTYPYQHGIRDNSGYRLAPQARTAATILKQAGYDTAAFIAAFPLHSRFGLNQGFDIYDDRLGGTFAPEDFAMPERPASIVVPSARRWIEGRATKTDPPGSVGKAPIGAKPWFVWVHLFEPHAPYRPPPPFDTQYASRPYYGEVAAADAALGPLVDDVRASARPTLVIVTGDHGESLGEHGEQSHGLFAYESTLRVPLMVAEVGAGRSTGRFDPSRGEASPVAARHVDVLPTLLDAVGLSTPRDLPGRTLLPAPERRAGGAPRTSYFEAMSAMLNRGWAPLSGVVVDREKYVDLPIAERYDLAKDAGERTNMAGRAPERDRTLAASLRAFQASLPGQRQLENPDAAARLRALGYVSGAAPAKTRYTEADDPKQLVDIDRAVHDAVDAFGGGRAADAVRLYEGVIARRPDMAIAYRHLAFVEWQIGKPGDAIAVLRRAIKAGVSDPRAIGQLGGYLTDTGNLAEGIRLLESVTSGAATDFDSLNALGIAYAESGQADRARAVFTRVQALNPESSIPLENLGLLALEHGDVGEARRLFERAVELDPRSSRAHAGVGSVAIKAGDRRTAVDAWTRAVQLDARNFDALYNLGTTLAREGDDARARPYLEQFLKTAPPAFYAKAREEVTRLLQRR